MYKIGDVILWTWGSSTVCDVGVITAFSRNPLCGSYSIEIKRWDRSILYVQESNIKQKLSAVAYLLWKLGLPESGDDIG